MKCVTVLLGGVSWLGEGSHRILSISTLWLRALTQPYRAQGAVIKNDDTPQTRQLFYPHPPSPTARWFILDLWVSQAPLSSTPELKDALHFQIKTSQVLHFCAFILFSEWRNRGSGPGSSHIQSGWSTGCVGAR